MRRKTCSSLILGDNCTDIKTHCVSVCECASQPLKNFWNRSWDSRPGCSLFKVKQLVECLFTCRDQKVLIPQIWADLLVFPSPSVWDPHIQLLCSASMCCKLFRGAIAVWYCCYCRSALWQASVFMLCFPKCFFLPLLIDAQQNW